MCPSGPASVMHGVLIDFYVEIPQNQPFLQPPSAHACPSARVPMGELGVADPCVGACYRDRPLLI